MDKVPAVILAVVLVAALFTMMGIGWRNRSRRQRDVPGLPAVPELGEAVVGVEGQYVCTTTEGDWLDRITAQGLGLRTSAVLTVYPEGVLITRSGAAQLFIAGNVLTGVRRESGMAGKFVERGGLLVLSWVLGERPVDTGFRIRYAAERREVQAALVSLLAPGARGEGEPGPPSSAGSPDP